MPLGTDPNDRVESQAVDVNDEFPTGKSDASTPGGLECFIGPRPDPDGGWTPVLQRRGGAPFGGSAIMRAMDDGPIDAKPRAVDGPTGQFLPLFSDCQRFPVQVCQGDMQPHRPLFGGDQSVHPIHRNAPAARRQA